MPERDSFDSGSGKSTHIHTCVYGRRRRNWGLTLKNHPNVYTDDAFHGQTDYAHLITLCCDKHTRNLKLKSIRHHSDNIHNYL